MGSCVTVKPIQTSGFIKITPEADNSKKYTTCPRTTDQADDYIYRQLLNKTLEENIE